MVVDKNIVIEGRRQETLKHVNKEQIFKAVQSLKKHVALVRQEIQKKRKDLFEDVEENEVDMASPELDTSKIFFLTFTLKQTPAKAFKTFKGHRIKVPYPTVELNKNLDICLFVKDKTEAKKWLELNPIHGVKKIISLQRLRTAYHTYQARRDLAATFEVFLADDRIVCMLPKALGRVFYSGAKRPLSVRLTDGKKPVSNLQTRVKEVVESCHFYLSGSCCSMKVARINQPTEQIVENMIDSIGGAVHYVPKKWDNIQAIHVKTGKSLALPIFNELPDSNVTMEEVTAFMKKRKDTNQSSETKTAKRKKRPEHLEKRKSVKATRQKLKKPSK